MQYGEATGSHAPLFSIAATTTQKQNGKLREA